MQAELSFDPRPLAGRTLLQRSLLPLNPLRASEDAVADPLPRCRYREQVKRFLESACFPGTTRLKMSAVCSNAGTVHKVGLRFVCLTWFAVQKSALIVENNRTSPCTPSWAAFPRMGKTMSEIMVTLCRTMADGPIIERVQDAVRAGC